MSKIYLGPKCESLDYSQLTPITRVNLVLDNDTMYTAGDDTGRTLEVECLWATQAMCNSILAQVGNKSYTAFTATQALLDPAAELGDSVTVGGVYGIIGNMNTTLDALCPSEISAPGGDEIDDEYPYKSASDRQMQRELAKIRSSITKTAEEITLRVEEVEDDYTELKVTLDGVTITDSTGTTKIKGSSIETSTLYVDAAHINGTLSASQINLTGAITWGDLASDAQTKVNNAQTTANNAANAASTAQNKANSAYNLADSTSDTISAWSYGSTTYIDGTQIMSGTVTATKLQGGTVNILTGAGYVAGYMTVSGASTASYAIDISSNGALRIEAGYGTLHLEGGGGEVLDLGSGYIGAGRTIRPAGDNAYSLGTAGWRWSEVYAATGTIQTSDRERKTDISYDLEKYDALFDNLQPASCKYVDGTSDRTHIVLISQDVEQALDDSGLSSQDFAGFVKSPREDGGYWYSLRYDEFVGLLIAQVQGLKARVAALEGT